MKKKKKETKQKERNAERKKGHRCLKIFSKHRRLSLSMKTATQPKRQYHAHEKANDRMRKRE
jgi:hypothetical protein